MTAWLGTWGKRRQITLDHTQISADLTQFPVPIRLSSSTGKTAVDVTSVFTELGASDLKLAVTQADGTSELYVEVEAWNATAKTALLWVSSSSWTVSSTADTVLYLYYDHTQPDNTAYVAGAGSRPEVWDSNFAVVNHLQGTVDSTSNGLNGTAVSSPTQTTGVLGGGAYAFSGSNKITIPDSTVYNGPSSKLTAEMWVTEQAFADYKAFFGKPASYSSAFNLYTRSSSIFFDLTQSGGTYNGVGGSTSTLTWLTSPGDGNWHHVVFQVDATVTGGGDYGFSQVFVDGVSVGNDQYCDGTASINNGSTIELGGNNQCSLDEFRLSVGVARPAAYVTASYQAGRDNLLTYGSEQTNSSGTAASGTGSLSLAGNAAGTAPATATGSMALSGSVTVPTVQYWSNSVTVMVGGTTATGSGALTLGGSGTASAPAAASGSFAIQGTAGWVAPPATGGLTLEGAATTTAKAIGTSVLNLGSSATVQAKAAATGNFSLGGGGTAAVKAAASGGVTLAGSGSPAAPTTGTAAFTLTGNGTARAPATATGAFDINGVATGAASAAGAGGIALGGSGTAQTPASGSGLITLGGSGTPGVLVGGSGLFALDGLGSTGNVVTAAGTFNLSGQGTVAGSAAANGVLSLLGSLAAQASISALGTLSLGGSAATATTTAGSGALALAGSGTVYAPVTAAGLLELQGTLQAAALTTASGMLTLSGSGTAVGIHAVPTPVERIFAVLAESRVATIRAETRLVTVAAEGRTATIPAESRDLLVPFESRKAAFT